MKKQNFSTLVKKSLFNLGFTGFLLIGITSAASAQDSVQSSNSQVKYIGSLNGQPVFKVDLDNQEGSVYHLTIKDEDGAVLYAEKIKSKQFSKKFKFESSDRSDAKLTFIIEGNKNFQSKEFKVNTNTEVFNNVVVTAL